MKGVFLGTPGGAEPPFTPMVTALIPSAVKMGIAFLVKPGTSLCAHTEMPYHMALTLDTEHHYTLLNNVIH